jgi:hypothetical protein
MSCYNWERGSIVIPSKEWAKFKKGLVAAYADIIEGQFAKAKQVYDRLMAKAKGRRKIGTLEWEEWLRAFDLSEHDYEKVTNVLDFGLLLNGKKNRPRRPLKKDFPFPNGKTTRFPVGWEGLVSLSDNKARTVHWSTGENNRAVEDAHGSRMGQAFFRLLGRITWTRGSGGQLVGNDEYNREDDYEGGGANYVTATYGPAKKSRARGFLR